MKKRPIEEKAPKGSLIELGVKVYEYYEKIKEKEEIYGEEGSFVGGFVAKGKSHRE